MPNADSAYRPITLTLFKLEVFGEDTVFYGDEKEAWEATKSCDKAGAGQITLRSFDLFVHPGDPSEMATIIAKLINIGRTIHTRPDDKFDPMYDGRKRTAELDEILNEFGNSTVFSVGGDYDINFAPEWIRWKVAK
jgi:hypothetical protein